MIASNVLLAIAVSGHAAAPAPSGDWLPVDPNVWTLLMDEPQAHLLRAQEDLSNKDTQNAAAEIRMADNFLNIQGIRLAISTKQLGDLANDIESGAITSPKGVDRVFNRAMSVMDHHQSLIPVMTAADTFIIDGVDGHLAQAKIRLAENEEKSAAEDIRRAAAYLKLKAVHAGKETKGELTSSAAELDGSAQQVEAGGTLRAQNLDLAIERARKAVRLPLEPAVHH
jgi:hypothetical protein